MERTNEYLFVHIGGRKIMKKAEFLSELRNKLQGLPKDDIEDRLSFYEEAINDRMDEGKSEEEAVADLGSVDSVVNEIAKDTPLTKLVKERYKPKRSLRPWEIVLLVLGFPLWFPLLLTFFILMFVAYLLIWVLDIVVYAIDFAMSVASIASLVVFIMYLVNGGTVNTMCLGSFIMCAGAAILLVFGCIGITRATLKLSLKILTGIKSLFIKKGRN